MHRRGAVNRQAASAQRAARPMRLGERPTRRSGKNGSAGHPELGNRGRGELCGISRRRATNGLPPAARALPCDRTTSTAERSYTPRRFDGPKDQQRDPRRTRRVRSRPRFREGLERDGRPDTPDGSRRQRSRRSPVRRFLIDRYCDSRPDISDNSYTAIFSLTPWQ